MGGRWWCGDGTESLVSLCACLYVRLCACVRACVRACIVFVRIRPWLGGARGGGGAGVHGDVRLRRAPDRGGGMGPCGGACCGRHPLSTSRWEGSRCRRRRRPRQPLPSTPLSIGRRLPRPPPRFPPAPRLPPLSRITAARRACSERGAAGGPQPPLRGAARQGGAGRSLTRRGAPAFRLRYMNISPAQF